MQNRIENPNQFVENENFLIKFLWKKNIDNLFECILKPKSKWKNFFNFKIVSILLLKESDDRQISFMHRANQENGSVNYDGKT